MIKAADRDLTEIKIGDKIEFKKVISESLVNQFAQISGDYNPLHMDSQYARTTNLKQRICHGMLLASFFSQVVGMFLPGIRALYLSQTLKFISPCYIDDIITIHGEVIGKSDSARIITLNTKIVNSVGESLVEGQAKVLVRK
jgi:acyl dehydratase